MHIDRRQLLQTSLIASATALASPTLAQLSQGNRPSGSASRSYNPAMVDVFEVTMATPDMILVEVRDPAIGKGDLVGPLAAPDPGGFDVWLPRTNPKSGKVEYAQIVGAEKRHLKFADRPATAYLDRAAAKDASGYGPVGGRIVKAVYYKAMPYDDGLYNSLTGGPATKAVSMKHFLHLKLDGRLDSGTHSIVFPRSTGLKEVTFSFDPSETRCSSIRVNQVGHRPSDIGKMAFLSLWVPGYAVEGAVNFARDYPDLSVFEVVDADNRVMFSGPIRSRIGPTEPEYTLENQLIRYVSTTVPPKFIKGISNSNPAVVRCPTHGFASGQIKHFRGTRMSGIDLANLVVTVIDADHFSVPVDTTRLGTWSSGHFLPGFDNLVYDTYLGNRAATYTYGLDYGAWTTGNGVYRIRIPGLGVSYSFRVDENVWRDVARASAKGFYHQLNGVELDGRFGFKRPVAFRDGVNGVKIYWSTLPAAFANESSIAFPNISSALGTHATWITDRRANGIYGSVMDAGDWDSFIHGHGTACYHLLDLGVEFLPVAAWDSEFNYPRSTELLDANLYEGTDSLPAAFHQAAFLFDFYRRLQNGDGSVGSGIGYSNGGGGSMFEPSYLSRQQAYIYAPDHASNFMYAGGAAKMSLVCRANGLKKLADLWGESALKAWNWAEPIYVNQAGEYDAYYIGVIDLKRKAGWPDEKYSAAKTSIQLAAKHARDFAAGVMFRLTNDRTFAKVVEPKFEGPLQGWFGDGIWEYIHAAHPDERQRRTYRNAYGPSMETSFVGPSEGKLPYRNVSRQAYNWLTPNFSGDENLIRSFLVTRSPRVLKTIQNGHGFGLGANQNGMCMTSGLGSRNNGGPAGVLHRDRQAMGVPQPDGYTTYTWWAVPGGGLVILNFGDDGPLNYLVEQSTGKHEATFGSKRVVEPYRWSWPVMEAYFENTYMINMTEYTFHQMFVPNQLSALMLHAWDKGGAGLRLDAQRPRVDP